MPTLRQLSIPARRHVAPVEHRIVDRLHPASAVGQRQLAVGQLFAGRPLLNVVPRAERVLVL